MMRNPSRPLVLALAASLFISSLPASAAGAIGRVAPVVPANVGTGIGAAGAVRMAPVTLAPVGHTFAAPSMGIGLKTTPLAVTGVVREAARAASPAAVAPRAAAPAPLAAAAPAIAAPADAAKPATVIAGVETAFAKLQNAENTGPAAPAAVLDRLFEGFERKGAANDAPAVVGRAAQSGGARLAPASSKAAADGPRWVLTGEQPAAPKSSWKRTAAIGYLAAIVPLTITMVITISAAALGYEFNSNYGNPAEGLGEVPSLLATFGFFTAAAVMAPVAEEIFFRAGLQGGLAKITKFLRLGGFWVPATLVSLLFVAVHETSDPVLFATRFIHAMILAYAFKKEGLLASMAAHGFFNGILTLPILLSAVVGLFSPDAMVAGLMSLGFMASVGIGALFFAVKAMGYLNGQRGGVKSGAIVPKAFTALHGLIALAVLSFGFFFLSPNPYWLLGIGGLVLWLLYTRFKR